MNKKTTIAETLKNFQPGAPVRLSGRVRHAEYRGRCGSVIRTIKSRGMVAVDCGGGCRYDAFPENVELLNSRVAQG